MDVSNIKMAINSDCFFFFFFPHLYDNIDFKCLFIVILAGSSHQIKSQEYNSVKSYSKFPISFPESSSKLSGSHYCKWKASKPDKYASL